MVSFFRELMFLCSGSVPTRRWGWDVRRRACRLRTGRLPGGGVISAVP